MAKVITTELQHSGASGANITLDSSKNVTCENNLQVDGNVTVTGTLPADKLTGALPAISGASLTGISSQDTLSNRNLMINGDMRISQRGAYTGQGTSGKYGPDRWVLKGQASGMEHAFVHQDTGMSEFPKCLRMDCTTAATGAVTEVKLTQMIESQDLGRFKFGTSSAESITVSFWCRSNQASTFVVWMHRDDGGRHNGKTFAISAADTWEKKTITFSPDTSGTPANDNTRGFQISWILNSGTGYTSGTSPNGTWEAITDVNRYVGLTATIGGNTNDYFDLTGVQVETGTTATDFEHRTYHDELYRCQRYFQVWSGETPGNFAGRWNGTSNFVYGVPLITPLRASPSIECKANDTSGSGNGEWKVFRTDGASTSTNVPTVRTFKENSPIILMNLDGLSSGTDDRCGTIQGTLSASGFFRLSAEL